MFKKIKILILLMFCAVTFSGCGLLYTALSAGAAYGIYQATR